MIQLKKIFATAALAVVAVASAHAQATERLDYKPFPHMFVSVQGGGQTTFTNYSNAKLITPTASVGFGAWFTPVVGARLHANGLWNKGGFENGTQDFKYNYKYATTDVDLMINLVTLFGKKDYYPVNLYLIGGVGLNYAWGNEDAYAHNDVLPFAWEDNRLSHNARVGAQVEWNICKNLGLNFEVAANSLSDRYNSKIGNKDDWSLTAQIGLAVKFGHKKAKPAPEVWETRIDTIWYDDKVYVDVTRDRDLKKEIFFEIREDSVDTSFEQIKAVAEFLKGVKNAEIKISAYADRLTGNPKINMGYSKGRALNTQRALIECGVDPAIIKSVEWFGDTVQPYAENDKNRVSIITGHGIYPDKDPKVEKKFRTKEIRYRVQ